MSFFENYDTQAFLRCPQETASGTVWKYNGDAEHPWRHEEYNPTIGLPMPPLSNQNKIRQQCGSWSNYFVPARCAGSSDGFEFRGRTVRPTAGSLEAKIIASRSYWIGHVSQVIRLVEGLRCTDEVRQQTLSLVPIFSSPKLQATPGGPSTVHFWHKQHHQQDRPAVDRQNLIGSAARSQQLRALCFSGASYKEVSESFISYPL